MLLSPGACNSAYFEHVFLAREMGVSWRDAISSSRVPCRWT